MSYSRIISMVGSSYVGIIQELDIEFDGDKVSTFSISDLHLNH